MLIEVKTEQVMVKEGTARGSGRPYKIREQAAWVDTGKAYPAEVRVRLADDQAPFPVGVYTISPGCFWVDRYGGLQVDLAKMQPAQKPSAAPVGAGRQAG
jgi:hypothetical protein